MPTLLPWDGFYHMGPVLYQITTTNRWNVWILNRSLPIAGYNNFSLFWQWLLSRFSNMRKDTTHYVLKLSWVHDDLIFSRILLLHLSLLSTFSFSPLSNVFNNNISDFVTKKLDMTNVLMIYISTTSVIRAWTQYNFWCITSSHKPKKYWGYMCTYLT